MMTKAVCADNLYSPVIAKSYSGAFKLPAEPSQGVAGFHGVAGDQPCRDTITLGALERAQIVTRRCGRDAFQPHSGLAMRTARALD